MLDRSSKRLTDPDQLAKFITDVATHAIPRQVADPPTAKNEAAVALGRLGGKKGGAARAASLTAEERSRIASRAATARWAKKNDS